MHSEVSDMKLSEFRRIIDALDDEAARDDANDENIVLELDDDPDEHEEKVGIGRIFRSKVSKNTVKIFPEDKVKKPVPPKEVKADIDPIIKQTSFFCPECGRRINKHDKFCRHCGQQIIQDDLYEKAEEVFRKPGLFRKKHK